MVFVHGHYQCTQCHQVCITCCEGNSDYEMQIHVAEATQNSNIPIDNDTISQRAKKQKFGTDVKKTQETSHPNQI